MTNRDIIEHLSSLSPISDEMLEQIKLWKRDAEISGQIMQIKCQKCSRLMIKTDESHSGVYPLEYWKCNGCGLDLEVYFEGTSYLEDGSGK